MKIWGRIWSGLFLIAFVAGFYTLPGYLPYLIMQRTLGKIAVLAGGYNRPVFISSQTEVSALPIIRPNPNLLLAACPYDLSAGNLEITAQVVKDDYWSLSFYRNNSDNFYVLSEQSVQGGTAKVRIAHVRTLPADSRDTKVTVADGTIVLYSPTAKGLALVRTAARANTSAKASRLPLQLERMPEFDCKTDLGGSS